MGGGPRRVAVASGWREAVVGVGQRVAAGGGGDQPVASDSKRGRAMIRAFINLFVLEIEERKTFTSNFCSKSIFRVKICFHKY